MIVLSVSGKPIFRNSLEKTKRSLGILVRFFGRSFKVNSRYSDPNPLKPKNREFKSILQLLNIF
ncbi:hypothetical protein CH376_17215 [Leptospira adleri]|uniref:Uncharacterized protein n=1 Tax=Leptospira adleri TaxID=2023186 RepID=A0ABX4P001_9LEPT|nr:hypothetical protein CH376_17215 [Leptospira adleri]